MNTIHGHRFYAMGSQMAVWLEHEDAQFAQQKLMKVASLFDQEEERLSRFLPNSELCQLNARAGEWVMVSEPLWAVVYRAVQLAEATAGLFNPTLLSALENVGYTRSFADLGVVPQVLPDDIWAGTHHYKYIEFDVVKQAIRLPAGVRLDLGGIGKGATAETAVSYLSPHGPCLIDAGGDLTAGSAPYNWEGWPVAIKAPWSCQDLMRLWLANASLATSGVDYRRWQQGSITQHHIIDGRTGKPAQTDLLTASILAPTACMAEAWATAMLVAGHEDSMAYAEEANLPACLIHANHQVTLTHHLSHLVQWEPIWDA